MKDETTNPIEKAREECLSLVSTDVLGWLFSPQFVAILQLSHIAGVSCAFLNGKCLPKAPYHGRTAVYSDVFFRMTAVVMKVWKWSLGEMTRRLRLYPELATACGYSPVKTISKSHRSRRLRKLGPVPFFRYFSYLVCQLIKEGVILANDLVIDSTTVYAWYQPDIEAGWSWAKKFGYQVHTVICRTSMLPWWFLVSPANRHDGPYGKPLLLRVVTLYKLVVEVVRADSAYWAVEFLSVIAALGARIAVAYNVRNQNRSIVPREGMLRWDSEAQGHGEKECHRTILRDSQAVVWTVSVSWKRVGAFLASYAFD